MGLTLKSAAARLPPGGVNLSTWWCWEKGRKPPNADHLRELIAMTSASEHAITMHDFKEEPAEADARKARKREVHAA